MSHTVNKIVKFGGRGLEKLSHKQHFLTNTLNITIKYSVTCLLNMCVLILIISALVD